MSKMVLTSAGIAEIVNAEKNGTAPVKLTHVAFGTGQYTATAERTALQAEFKRFDAISGGGVGDNLIHVSVQDESFDSYTVYEIGVFTESGTLFAVYSQSTPLNTKAEQAILMQDISIVLGEMNPASVIIGDTNFQFNSATTEREGVVEIATEAEAKAGTDTKRAITPATLDKVIEGHDNIVHRSGNETISGSKNFTRDITVTTPATSAPTGIKIADSNNKGIGYLAQYYAGNEYYTRVMCKNNTSGKSAHIDVKINDDGTSMFSPNVDVMCAPSVSENDKSAKVATTEWVANQVAKYLPLSGGTLSGTVFTSGSGSPVLSAKKDNLNGGRIFLFAPDDSDFLGGIVLRAYNSDNTSFVDLTIKSDNTITWGSKNIVRSVDGVNANAAGNVTLNALPKSGGAMTTQYSITRDVSNSYLGLFGGTGEKDGAQLDLCGKDHASQPGGFQLHARNADKDIILRGEIDGRLRWDGKHIVRSINGELADASGNLDIGVGMPIGTVFSYASATPPEGAYLLNGQTIENCDTLYPEFWNWLQTADIRKISEETYETYLSQYGYCGAFCVWSSTGKVRLPTYTNAFLMGGDSSNIGRDVPAGLPNIEGSWQAVHGTYAGENNYFNVDGAIEYIASENSRNGKDVRGNTSTTAPGDRLGFDASRSNSIYGNSDTVQPPAIRVSLCIQVYNAATALSEQESAQLASEMQLKAQTDLANVDSNLDWVVESWRDGAGGWYRKYRSGWVEQGGRVSIKQDASVTVTFFIEFASTDYHANWISCNGSSSAGSGTRAAIPQTTATIELFNGQDCEMTAAWYACGQSSAV